MRKYFFCYDKHLTRYLTNNGLSYITKAIHPASNKVFCLFESSNELNTLLDEWNMALKEKKCTNLVRKLH